MKEGARPTSPVSAAEEPIVFVIDDDPLMLGGVASENSIHGSDGGNRIRT
jgi:hypothetical protein